MRNKTIYAALLAVSLHYNVYSQNVELKLNLYDGTVLTGTSQLNNVSLQTDFGKLEIPLKSITSIEVGIKGDNGQKEKVESLIKQLANSNEEVRKSAYEMLTTMNLQAIPLIENFISSTSYEPSTYMDYTAENACSDLKGIYNISSFSTQDILSLEPGYTIGGNYDFKKIDLKTDYGQLSIPRDKIKSIDLTYLSTEKGDRKVKLYANKHISGNTNGGWLKTGITLKAGQRFTIKATGEIVLASLSNAKYKPNGKTDGATADYGIEESTTNAYPTYGNVVYKIGDSTEALRAGDHFTGIAKKSGILYIAIYETVFSESNTGFYTVTITSGK